MLDTKLVLKLEEKIPQWAIKPHPTKAKMTVIHPMAVIERLNDVFGVGEWEFKTEYIQCNPFVQKTQKGSRDMFMSAVKGILLVPKYSIHLEQYGGSSNDDMGDALKGGATDSLTKIASYLGIGASIYKGQGNIDAPMTAEEAITELSEAKSLDELKTIFLSLPQELKKDSLVVAKKDALKNELEALSI